MYINLTSTLGIDLEDKSSIDIQNLIPNLQKQSQQQPSFYSQTSLTMMPPMNQHPIDSHDNKQPQNFDSSVLHKLLSSIQSVPIMTMPPVFAPQPQTGLGSQFQNSPYCKYKASLTPVY